MNKRREIAKRFANNINSDYIKRIILFGSVARGDDNEDSNIDILIISSYKNEIEPQIGDEVVNTLLNDHEFISAHVISENHYEKTKNFSFLKNVNSEGEIIG